MKILVTQDYLRSGGTERQAILLTRAFAESGHPARLLTFRPGGALASTLGTVERQCLQTFDTGLDWFAPGLARTVAEYRPDIVLCMGRIANCYAGHLQRRQPAAAVVSTFRTGKALPWLFRRSLSQVRHVVANSEEARRNLIAAERLPGEKVSTIHNGLVFPPALSPDDAARIRAATRTAHGASAQTLVLLSVAMFRPEKGQRNLLPAVAALPADLDWQLWLAGDGPARAACERDAAALGLGDRVKFLGWQKDPAPLYAAADLAVHASVSEALSNFLIEAQAHGLAGVAWDAQGIRECFLDGETGLALAPGDPSVFARAIRQFAAVTPEARAARSARASSWARDRFAPDRQVRAYLDLFGKILSGDFPVTPSRS